ncbi:MULTISPECIES: hypothetical protein [Olivibacter]|uniref:PKD-like family protein n=1 Tax=Olivibacter oleidegradans TaxID=760123 RepID=A0ABV6HEC0_9SPHI|nr:MULTISPECIES: hypothetical protein [Olivibacter]MDM8177734.1 hypothetical protein [Olivibacter sp. 47]QEK99704.1 hypothetical protein FKG96_02450 [Olivibacter sp. LS-1]
MIRLNTIFFKIFFLLVALSFMISCNKDNIKTTDQEEGLIVVSSPGKVGQYSIIDQGSAVLQPTKVGRQSLLDWEHIKYMPTPAGKEPILAPWFSLSQDYDSNYMLDFKKRDGWELLYNTFSTEYENPLDFFILYNKYRGIIRMYKYIDNTDISQIKDLNVLYNTIKMHSGGGHTLIFSDQLIVDLNKQSNSVSIIEPKEVKNNSWYISEFEVAYDPNVSDSQMLNFVMGFGKTTQSTIGRHDFSGSLPLRFNIQNQSFPYVGGAGELYQINLRSAKELQDAKNIIPEFSIDSNILDTNDSKEIDLFNAVTADKKMSQMIKVATTASVNNLVNNALITTPVVGCPGFDWSNGVGEFPIFNESLGVFYLNKMPEVFFTKTSGELAYKYQLNEGSLEYLFNPFVSKYATIENIEQEMLAVEDGVENALISSKVYKGRQLSSNKALDVVGVRVSFDLVPSNGSSKVHIIKTFKANIVDK